jgi:hypothetical protein
VLEDVVGFADELHVAVLDAVVDHLHVVTGTAGADVDDAGLAIDLRGDGFKDGLHDFPSGSRAAGHDGGAFAGAFFTAGDARADEAEAFFGEVGVATLGGLVEAVAAVDDDVVLVQERDELLDHGVHGVAVGVLHGGGFHHDVDLAREWRGSGRTLRACLAPTRALPGCLAMNSSVTLVVRLKTLTWKPRLSTFRTRFWPITARPINPKSFCTVMASSLAERGTHCHCGPRNASLGSANRNWRAG